MPDTRSSIGTVTLVRTQQNLPNMASRQRKFLAQARAWEMAGMLSLACASLAREHGTQKGVAALATVCHTRADQSASKHGAVSNEIERHLLSRETDSASYPFLEGTLYQDILDYTHDPAVLLLAVAKVARREAVAKALAIFAAGAVPLLAGSAPGIAHVRLLARGSYWLARSVNLSKAAGEARLALAGDGSALDSARARLSQARGGLGGLEERANRRRQRRVRLVVTTAVYARNQSIVK